MPYYWQGETLLLRITAQPKSKRIAFAGVHNHRLKIQLTAPPSDGAANRQLQTYLADCFGVAKSCVQLTMGAHSREKCFTIRQPRKLPKWLSLSQA